MSDELLRYDPAFERADEDEQRTFEAIVDTFAAMGQHVAAQEGRAVRVSHAKATALLTGQLIVDEDLPAPLAQGLAARGRTYATLVRFAQGPGEVLHDRISTHRGLALKLLDVDGATQDFVLEGTGRAFINSNAKTFLANLRAGVSNAPSLPEGVKNVVSKVARGTEAALEAVGLESKTLAFFGHEPLHPLAEPYFSQVPMRWGDYVAKIGLFPTAETLARLSELRITHREEHDAFRVAMVDHFANAGATFEFRVQLATDLERTPIEDAAKEWPAEVSPYRPIGRLVLPPQRAWSAERSAWFERLSFRPSHSHLAHRPLGQIMRARLFVYERLATMRRQANGEMAEEPTTLADVPA